MGWTFFHLVLICILTLIGNWVAVKITPWTALRGMLLIFAVCAVDGEYAIVLPRSSLGDEGFQQIVASIREFAGL
jgi:hypothetical protein